MPRAALSGEAFGDFSVKLTHAMNVPLDAVGAGMCAILYMTLPVPSPRERFGGKKGAVGSCFGGGGIEFQREIPVFAPWSL